MNMEASDQELLRAFVRERSEDAFRRLVNRHLDLVFATARRILGDPQLAEEVAQGVFLLLARKAGDIGNQQPLAGWLYHTARHHALNTSRAEGRRRQREQTAAAMQTHETTPEPEWIAAEIEGALEELPAEDRDALVLRFLDNRQLREVGVELGISEEAARKRVSRALDKLRGIFGKRGVALSTGLLTTALAAQAGAAAPAGLGATIVASALTGLTAASATAITATQTTTTLMNLFNLKTAAAILGAAAVTGTTTYLVQEREAERLRADYQTLNETHGKLAAEQQEARALIQLRDEQIERFRRDLADLPRLRGEVDRLNRQVSEMAELRKLNEELNQSVASLHQTYQSRERAESDEKLIEEKVEERATAILRLNDMRRLSLPWIMHADKHGGWVPDKAQFEELLLDSGEMLNVLQLEKIEIVFQGRLQDLPPGSASRTIVLKQVDFTTSADGQKVTRAYGFADGHSEIHSAANLQELTTWENRHIIPLELQSRRPE